MMHLPILPPDRTCRIQVLPQMIALSPFFILSDLKIQLPISCLAVSKSPAMVELTDTQVKRAMNELFSTDVTNTTRDEEDTGGEDAVCRPVTGAFIDRELRQTPLH